MVFSVPGEKYGEFQVPCGHCIGCRLERSRQWAVRCVHEAQLHEHSSFITLTYNDANVPADGSLRYEDFSLFMKKIREEKRRDSVRRLGTRAEKRRLGARSRRASSPNRGGLNSTPVFCKTGIRFYMCGEYGEKFNRPHFHACLFGIHFSDRKLYKSLPSGSNIYTSEWLEDLWGKGFASIGDVTFESAAYVARYIMKKVTGGKADWHYQFSDENGEVFWKEPEFNKMSLKPGIGARWLDKFHADVYPADYVVVRGLKMKPPKYYDKKAVVFCKEYDDVVFEREKKALLCADDCTPERLKVRQICKDKSLEFLKRTLE